MYHGKVAFDLRLEVNSSKSGAWKIRQGWGPSYSRAALGRPVWRFAGAGASNCGYTGEGAQLDGVGICASAPFNAVRPFTGSGGPRHGFTARLRWMLILVARHVAEVRVGRGHGRRADRLTRGVRSSAVFFIGKLASRVIADFPAVRHLQVDGTVAAAAPDSGRSKGIYNGQRWFPEPWADTGSVSSSIPGKADQPAGQVSR